MKEVKFIKVEQPIGTFYLTSLKASILAKIATVNRRNESPDAVQREQSESRIKEISKYCGDSDATFPTPIIIAVNESAQIKIDEDSSQFLFNEDEVIGEVIDGQHRLEGLKMSNHITRFELPVVFMFNLYPEEKAYVFSIINSKQTRVNMSLIYDLFALSTKRSPYKTCHEIARALNKEENSPFHNRLKMLGKKEEGQDLASLSQGTFIKYLVELISKKPDEDTRKLKREEKLIISENEQKCVLREYFIEGQDTVIYKIILNLFSAVQNTFKEEWSQPDTYILSKAIGFGSIIKAFPEIYKKGVAEQDLSEEFFAEIFMKFKSYLEGKEIDLTSKNFGSNEQARSKLAGLISESLAV